MTTTQPSGAQVNLYCDDVERCVAFYAALGLREAFRATVDDAPAHVEVQAPGFRVGLTAASALRELGLDASPRGASAELVLWCDDVDATFALACDAGGERLVAPTASPDGRLRYGWLRDPDGHTLKLVQHAS